MINPVIIFGAKSLGKVVLEILQQNDIMVYGFLDDDETLHNTEINLVTILGGSEDQAFLKLVGKKCDACIATDDVTEHKIWVNLLKEKRKTTPINVIHPNNYIAQSAKIGNGNIIQARAVINTEVIIGNHCNIGLGAKVDANAKIANFVQIGMGTNIGTEVEIEDKVFIGAGATLVSGIKIAENARIGAGSVVISNVGESETFFGNPAKKIDN